MAQPEFDWTFDHIPSDAETELAVRRPVLRPQARPGKDGAGEPRRRRRWMFPAVMLALATLAGLGVYAFYWLGWQRMRSQIRDEIAYEDERSRAGDAEIVESLQADDSGQWMKWRAAEAILGLPAPLPAGNLLPVPEPAEVLDLASRGPNVFEATVLRTFADSAGEKYQFELTQRYRNLGPGLWERLPPDETRLQSTTTWTGRHLTVTYPILDAPWMEAALPQIDAYLVAACADWDCPDELTIPVSYSGKWDGVPLPSRTVREPGPVAAYPIIFDLASEAPRYPRRVVLPSPHLAGYPHDEAASAALIRATTARLLGALAGELASMLRSDGDYFLNALIARAEVRLGISSAPKMEIRPHEYLPPTSLWSARPTNLRPTTLDGPRPHDIAFRLQALNFLDFALAAYPPSADAGLLRRLRRSPDLATWLESGLGAQADVELLIEAWTSSITAHFVPGGPPAWTDFNGLVYACQDGAGMVRDGRLQALPFESRRVWLGPGALSGDGRYLAVYPTDPGDSRLQVLDLTDLTFQSVGPDSSWVPLGWSAPGQLVYAAEAPQAGGPIEPLFRLMLYDPKTRTSRPAIAQLVLPVWGSSSPWSADHTTLSLSLMEDTPTTEPRAAPAIVSFGSPLQVLVLDGQGYSPVLSPDAKKVAYIGYSGVGVLEDPRGNTTIELVDLETQATTTLLTSEALRVGRLLQNVGALQWSPDGAMLAFAVYGEQSGAHLFTVSADGGEPRQWVTASGGLFPVGFSPDGRYLAVNEFHLSDTSQLTVFDLQSDMEEAYVGAGAAWSPQGHLLAVSGPGGVYVTDPASGDFHWLTLEPWCSLAWYALPR